PCAILVTQLTKEELQTKQIPIVPLIVNENRRTRTYPWFWAFLFAASLAGLTGGVVLANLLNYMKDLNFSVSRISFVASAYGALMVFVHIILGILYDLLCVNYATLMSGLLISLSLNLMLFFE